MEKHSEQEKSGKSVGPETPAKAVEQLYALIDGIEIAMMTTRSPEGELASRAMANQKPRQGVDLWFMTNKDSHKLDDLRKDPKVNLAYYQDGEWVSVSGHATISEDRAKIRELYKPDWKAWLGDEGGERDGGPNDPRIALIEVEAVSVTYQKRTVSKPVMLFNIVKGMITGEPPKIGVNVHLDKGDLASQARPV